jgi:crotonobetainyl-CoA:carnitine CoA-transferase CaiB-like acyl-CoA transferase
VQHLGIAETVHSDTLGPITLNGQPITLSRTDSAIQSATPALGQHTDEVLGWLGYTPDDIAKLRRNKVL